MYIKETLMGDWRHSHLPLWNYKLKVKAMGPVRK